MSAVPTAPTTPVPVPMPVPMPVPSPVVTRYQPPHIAGNPALLTPLQRELIQRVAALGPAFAARAARDRKSVV